MAKAQAIAVTGQSILGLLADNISKTDFPNASFKLYQPSNFQSPMEEGISLFLYRVEINAGLRNVPGKIGLDGLLHQPPLPLDLHYLLTVWAKDAVKQQQVLGIAMRTLNDTAILSAEKLNHFGDQHDVFQPSETVEILFNSLSLQDISNLWSAFKISVPMSVAYIARVVGIDSAIKPKELSPVQTRETGY